MLNHPNILKLQGVFEESDKIFLVLEYMSMRFVRIFEK